MNSQHRRARLKELLAKRFHGDRQAFLARSQLTKGRLTQLLDDAEAFGERAARSLERRLNLPALWLDVSDALMQSGTSAGVDDGRILVPVTSREELCLELFKKLTPQQQEVMLHDLRLAADANRITEKVKGSPVARHAPNIDVEVAYGLPRRQGEHPKAR